MARVVVEDGTLSVALSLVEKVGAMRGDVSVPLDSITDVHVASNPWREVRWARAGVGLPGVISLGVRRGPSVRDFTAIYLTVAAVVVNANGPFSRLVVSSRRADELAAKIRTAVGLAEGAVGDGS
jgi:hypothetical protein